MKEEQIKKAYEIAKERYAAIRVYTINDEHNRSYQGYLLHLVGRDETGDEGRGRAHLLHRRAAALSVALFMDI